MNDKTGQLCPICFQGFLELDFVKNLGAQIVTNDTRIDENVITLNVLMFFRNDYQLVKKSF